MTATAHDQSSAESSDPSWTSHVRGRDTWATVTIVTMWIAVLFVGVFGGDMTFRSVDSSVTTMPAGVAVALFAAIATGSVAKRVFGRRPD